MRTFLLILLIVFQVRLLVYSQKTERFYDMEQPPLMNDSVAVDTDDENKRIFIGGRSFKYVYNLKKSGRQYHYAVVKNEKALKDSTVKYVDWKFVPADSVFESNTVYPITSLGVHVYKGNSGLAPGHASIRYEYLNGSRRVFLDELSSISERPERIYLGLPHFHGFVFNKFNPMPIVSFPLTTGKTWSQFISIPDQMLKSAKLAYTSSDGLFHFTSDYKVEGDTVIYTRLGAVMCKKIDAVAQTEIGTTFSTFYFNEQWGFVRIEQRNLDGSEIAYQLTAVDDN